MILREIIKMQVDIFICFAIRKRVNSLKRSFILGTTQDSFACTNMTILHSFDLPGADIYSANYSSYSQCCIAYTCFMKNGTFVSAHF